MYFNGYLWFCYSSVFVILLLFLVIYLYNSITRFILTLWVIIKSLVIAKKKIVEEKCMSMTKIFVNTKETSILLWNYRKFMNKNHLFDFNVSIDNNRPLLLIVVFLASLIWKLFRELNWNIRWVRMLFCFEKVNKLTIYPRNKPEGM